jgi:UDP-glucose 4-epimerase
MATVLITGAHGFIGRHLAASLAASGHQICGLGHGMWPASEAANCGVAHWLNGDITAGNLQLLQRLAGTPDVVYHLAGGSSVGAAIANPKEDFFRTVATTAELLEWMRLCAPDAELVVVSSAAVYGAGHVGPIGESAVLNPFSPYGHHKRLMEELCRSYGATYGLRVVIARLFSVFGPRLKKQLLWDLCCQFAQNRERVVLEGSGDELRDWIDIGDVSRALALLPSLASQDVPAFNVGTGAGTSVRDVANTMAAYWVGLGRSANRPAIVFSGHGRAGDPFSLVADTRRIQAVGFCDLANLNSSLKAYAVWFCGQMGGN